MRCSALAVFDRGHVSADRIRPETGWDQWEREMEERGCVIPSVRVLTDTSEAANRASASTQVGDIDIRVAAELYHRPSRSDEVVSERDEKAKMSDGTWNTHTAQRHSLLIPNRSSPFGLDRLSMLVACAVIITTMKPVRGQVLSELQHHLFLNTNRLPQIRARWAPTLSMTYHRDYLNLWIEFGNNRLIASPPMEDGGAFC
eukprot:2138477-Pyramimonas_sp.AAC.1